MHARARAGLEQPGGEELPQGGPERGERRLADREPGDGDQGVERRPHRPEVGEEALEVPRRAEQRGVLRILGRLPGALELRGQAGLAACRALGPRQGPLGAGRAPARRAERPYQVHRAAGGEAALAVALGPERRQHGGQGLARQMCAQRAHDGQRPRAGRGAGQREPAADVHWQRPIGPR